MKKRRLVVAAILVLAAATLAACEPGSPEAIELDTPQQLRAESTDNLCAAYGINHFDAAALDELRRRGAVAARFADNIARKQVAIGMSKCEVLAAWGRPDDINRTITGAGTREQWVWDNSNGFPIQFVYFTDGVVDTIQN